MASCPLLPKLFYSLTSVYNGNIDTDYDLSDGIRPGKAKYIDKWAYNICVMRSTKKNQGKRARIGLMLELAVDRQRARAAEGICPIWKPMAIPGSSLTAVI